MLFFLLDAARHYERRGTSGSLTAAETSLDQANSLDSIAANSEAFGSKRRSARVAAT